MPIHIPAPDLQISFATNLLRLRDVCLLQALRKIVGQIDITALDRELSRYAPKSELARLATAGLRGETAFCVPILLKRSPALLGYYRLLLGFSQKAFFTSATGLSAFKCFESDRLPDALLPRLDELCKALSNASTTLTKSMTAPLLTDSSFNDLALLTLGAQLRGGANVTKGTAGIERVFKAIHHIVGHAAVGLGTTSTGIAITNSAGRLVTIEFAADPDIVIREELTDNNHRNVIAIEVKAGTDFSNIHNRVGEAEKSHQKAKKKGYVECWTIVNVENFNIETAHRESPTTNRFYRLSQIELQSGVEYEDFKARIISLVGIASGKTKKLNMIKSRSRKSN